ncbi:MAG TPA: hypothetical protein VIV40_25590 [Kofleriaceae bacterium]
MRKLLAMFVLLAACDAYDQDLGPTPFLCGPDEPRCPMGYACKEDPANGAEVCVASDDSLSNNFDCHDDSDTEPNDKLDMATMTPIDTQKTYSLDGRAICPAGDKDTYAVMLTTASQALEMTIVYEANGATLAGAILNTGGVPISSATAVDGQQRTLRASARNLPIGLYYVQVFSPLGGTIAVNNYSVSIAVSGP